MRSGHWHSRTLIDHDGDAYGLFRGFCHLGLDHVLYRGRGLDDGHGHGHGHGLGLVLSPGLRALLGLLGLDHDGRVPDLYHDRHGGCLEGDVALDPVHDGWADPCWFDESFRFGLRGHEG